MKRNTLLLLSATFCFSFLFFRETPGLNVLIFNVLLITLSIIRDKEVLTEWPWWAVSVAALITSFATLLYGIGFPVIANLVACCALSGYSISKSNSLVSTLVFSGYTYITALLYDGIRWTERLKGRPTPSATPPRWGLWLSIGVPVIVTAIFFLLYRGSNPLFRNLTDQITFDWFSWAWFWFTLLGFWWSYGFFYYRTIPELAAMDAMAPPQLSAGNYSGKATFTGWSIDHEWLSGVVMLGLLNGLLLVVNGLDVAYLFVSHTPPATMTYSEYVHQGTSVLIISIVVAIALLLFYFKGDLNFYKQSRSLKILALIWVAQNLFMVYSTAHRNSLYIEEYSLTYKRIGVYVYLGLAAIGLLLTAWKILSNQTNWQLIRNTGWAFFITLSLATLVNWDGYIARFNLEQSARTGNPPDIAYLVNLSYLTLPALLDYPVVPGSGQDILLQDKIWKFEHRQKDQGWPSYSIQRDWTMQRLQAPPPQQ